MVTLEVGPGVDLPEAEPPRLLLRVEFQPDHVTQLRLGLPLPGRRRRPRRRAVPLRRAARAIGDPDAEEALLAALPEGPWPAGSEGSRRRVAEQASLTGAATADFVTHWLDRLAAAGVLVETRGDPGSYRLATQAPRVSLSVTDPPEGTDWFNLSVSVTIEDELVEFRELFTALAIGQTPPDPAVGHLVQPGAARAGPVAPPDRGGQRAHAPGERRPAAPHRARRSVGGAAQPRRRGRAVGGLDAGRCPRCFESDEPAAGTGAGGAGGDAASLPGTRFPLAALPVPGTAGRHPRRRHGAGQDHAGARAGVLAEGGRRP